MNIRIGFSLHTKTVLLRVLTMIPMNTARCFAAATGVHSNKPAFLLQTNPPGAAVRLTPGGSFTLLKDFFQTVAAVS